MNRTHRAPLVQRSSARLATILSFLTNVRTPSASRGFGAMNLLLLSLLCFLASLLPVAAFAQVATGTPPFGSFGGGPDVINLANLNSHIMVNLLNKPGRGLPLQLSLFYDSAVWSPVTSGSTTTWTPVNATNWGWAASSDLIGFISFTTTFAASRCPNNQFTSEWVFSNWRYYDAMGTPHPFPGNSYTIPCPGGNISEGFTSKSSDSSGYQITTSGSSVTSLSSSEGSVVEPQASIQDRNGNQITRSGGAYTDTLGTTALTVAGSGTPSSPLTFTYSAPSGANAAYTLKYTTFPIQTNFACGGVTEYGANGTTTATLITEIDLPDQSVNSADKYTFTYEPTPGHSGFVTGRLASVTLPTGGQITYSYSGGNNGINCADGSTATLTRATPDGTWTYAQVKGSGQASTTTVTDPQGNVTVLQFQGIYETQRQVYRGSASPANLLQTTNTCYNGSASPCTATPITLPITQRDVTDIFPSNLQCLHRYKYNAFGGMTEQDDYDYGSGSPGALRRQTLIAFAALGNNINAFRQSVTVKDGSGAIVSQTTYNYDETTPTATSGVAQHNAVTGSRGNLTSIYYPVSGLTERFTYWDTGSIKTHQDVNGAMTTYNYSSNAASCQMAFPTGITEAISPLAQSYTWDCNGGVQLTFTDENNQTTTATYSDPYFWRPAKIDFPDGGETSFVYNSPTSLQTKVKMNSSLSIVATTILDGLGRTTQQQLNSDPEGVDYTDFTYDSLGRLHSQSNPHRSSGSSTDGTTTFAYDPLNRLTSTTLPDGSVSSALYVDNTVTVTDAAGKKRKLTVDALGRLTQVVEDPGGLGYTTAYSYDALGDLTAVVQNGGRNRTFTYDALGRLTAETTPEGGTITYGYDASGHQGDLTSRVAPAPNQTGSATVTTTYSYDALHRLTAKSYSDGVTPSVNFYYDQTTPWAGVTPQHPLGRLTSTNSWNSVTQSWVYGDIFSYDSMGRVLNHTQCTPKSCSGTPFSVSYSYDLAGNLLTGSNGVGVILSYGYDAAARPTQVASSMNDSQHPATLATIDPSVGYYPPGGLRKLTFANNLTQTAAFNSLLQPCRVNVNSSGTALGACADAIPSGNVQDFSYSFPAGSNNGNVSGWTATGTQAFSRAFSYDALNRLSTLNQSSGNATGCSSAFGLSWSYDAWGNRTDQNVTSGSCNAFHVSVDANNRLSGAPYQYDAAGNLTQDASHHYFYDAENRLVQVDGTFGTCSTATACYLYDALGHRVEKQTGSAYVDYVHDLDGNVVTEYCTNCSGYTGWTEGYVYLGGSLLAQYAQGTTFFAHSDHLGSTRLLTGLGSNLVSNPGFESGETNWNSNNASLIVAVTDPSRAHSGSGYIQISESDPSTGPSIVGQPIAVQAGDQITFGGWVYLESGGGGALGWWMETMDANHNVTNWIGAGASPTTSGWTLQSNIYTVPPGVAYVALYATNWQPTSPTVIRVDDGFLIDNRSSLQVVQNLDYLPFGELNSSDSAVTSHKFTGDERDGETGLDHTLFRKYSSTLGRWTTPDPASLTVASPAFPQSWNRYSYVLNNPMNLLDPSGLECVWDDGSYDSIEDVDTGSADSCSGAGGTWVDHSFFIDFGLPDWSGSASSDLAAVVAGIQAGFALVQTGSGLSGWMLVANNGAGPIDWSLLINPLPTPNSSGGNTSGFTVGIRAPGQTYRQCLSANSSTYSLNTFTGTDTFLLSNDVSGLAFGDRAEASLGATAWEGGSRSFEAGVGEVMTAGRRTASIRSLNLAGKTGPAARILAKTGAEKLAGWLTGAAELKLAADIGLTAAEAIGCAIPR